MYRLRINSQYMAVLVLDHVYNGGQELSITDEEYAALPSGMTRWAQVTYVPDAVPAPPPPPIEMVVRSQDIAWRTQACDWTSLITLDALRGPQGPPGPTGALGPPGAAGSSPLPAPMPRIAAMSTGTLNGLPATTTSLTTLTAAFNTLLTELQAAGYMKKS